MMITLATPTGLPYQKKDGECAHPACKEIFDFHEHDEPTSGWAVVTMKRYVDVKNKKKRAGGASHLTFMLCPKHTINFTLRQTDLFGRVGRMIKTAIESPFAGDVARNLRYLRAAMADSFKKREAPYASHALYTQEGVLDDKEPSERKLGMEAGFLWGAEAEKVAVYTDLGTSNGMMEGIKRAEERGQIVEVRKIPGWA